MINRFPAVRFVVRHGGLLAPLAASLPMLLAVAAVGLEGLHWFWLVCGGLVGAACGFVVRLLAEMTIIIADMLLPE